MIPSAETLPRKSRLRALVDHFADVQDPRDVERIAHRLDDDPAPRRLQPSPTARTRRTSPRGGSAASRLPQPAPALRARRPGERWLAILMTGSTPRSSRAAARAGCGRAGQRRPPSSRSTAGPHRHRQAIHRIQKKVRRIEPRLPRSPHLLTARLTWIRSPASARRPGRRMGRQERPGEATPSRPGSDQGAGHSPLNLGVRFSRKASMPSALSSVAKSE